MKFRILLITISLFVYNSIFSQAPGDYQSNVVTTGIWSTASSWQIFDGLTWVTATVSPSSTDGIITIRSGHDITLNSAIIIDQVVVETGAILRLFNNTIVTTFTLADAAGTDMIVSGELVIGLNGILSGTGTITINPGGIFNIRNPNSKLSVNTTNLGTSNFTPPGTIEGASFVNEGITNFLSTGGTFTIRNGSFINNSSVNFTGISFIAISGTGGIFRNTVSGIINKANTVGLTTVNNSISEFTNAGIIRGSGAYSINSTIATLNNTGNISPGYSSPDLITMNAGFISGKNPTINLSINSSGATAIINYDQFALNSSDPDLSLATLNVTLDPLVNDPVGTIYTLVTSTGTILNPFLNAIVPPNHILTYNTNTITLQKTAVTPLLWGNFKLTYQEPRIVLEFETFDEYNVSHLIIEHSTNGNEFKEIGRLKAKNEIKCLYSFTDNNPTPSSVNYYRIKQIDLDGKFNYSIVRKLNLGNQGLVTFKAFPNPFTDQVQVTLNQKSILRIFNQAGKEMQIVSLSSGTNVIDLGGLMPGYYFFTYYTQNNEFTTYRMIKK